MSTTQAQAAVLEQVASRFDDVQQSLSQLLSQLMREVESVRQDWQGRGGATFEQVSQAWAQDQRQLLRALAETAGGIRSAGRLYSATDDAAAGRLTHGNVSLPL